MAPAVPAESRYTSERYFQLVGEGVLHADDRVELLEGVVVAMSPQSPRHAFVTNQVADVLRSAVGTEAAVRVQSPLVVGPLSVPEPDAAVVAGGQGTYREQHPTTALLVVEVADSSLLQDRITKAGIYASAGIPEYWIIDLHHDRVEVYRDPDPIARTYRERRGAQREEIIPLAALGGLRVAVSDLLPAA